MNAGQQDPEEVEIATDLVARIGAGDRAAEAALVERYQPRLLYVMRRQMARYPDDVDDLVQNALTAALVRLRERGIDEPARLGGFIYGVARNLRLAHIRDRARHDGDLNPDVIDRLADDQAEPERLVAGAETTRLVRRLLAELGETRGRERDREVLIRLYLEQQDRDEICRALDIAPDHLRRVLHRAKQRLRRLLEDARASGGPDLMEGD